ncbi:MAG: M1 family metallopeptidase, partial [Bacteroidia bacterium]
VAYGNQFKKGYLGSDMSGTGYGLKWDYITVHESGHEWFANNVTTKDIADMWIHEGFTSYSEVLFTEYTLGKEAGSAYLIGLRKGIANRSPIIGPYNVNKEGSGDMYPKGANLIHTIRQLIDNDEKFRMILRGINKTFYHTTTTSAAVEDYIAKQSGLKLTKVFDQYLRHSKIPVLEYKIQNGVVQYRWLTDVKGFDMRVKVSLKSGGYTFISPTNEWKSSKIETGVDFKVEPNFYVKLQKATD